ncbi:SDR family NAD(P)-dependent oxidoreductase [Pseudohoeflea coraliihabitans]|uniref:SDR family oxidoreductase n=1 Tax=Pseudohoeflea coraliihabitans TaxID=2860393 RepID=A0ABS6WSN3_9HYPH|nr:SDR family NAD(P)-dependent oxidoreductase [Pseudohoeflea sp. DP4N28-3]MBW3098442.1 SDR family oxidoreductase [Pseudohoeflea sp. DP4N28-3]
MYGLEGKRAIVTGAAHGIGRAVSERLIREGCSVALWDIDGGGVRETTGSLSREGGQAAAYEVDVSDREAVAAAHAEVMAKWGAAPDILVNNAGIGQVASILDAEPQDFDRTLSVNIGGTYNCCHVSVPAMRDAGGGLIVNIASWFGKSGRPMSLAYCASKFAIIGMTQSMALDLATSNIRVNAVCPGTITDTRMREMADAEASRKGLPASTERQHLIPLGRLGKPRDIANAVAYLVSDEADYMTGQSINVTGGLWMN